MRKLLLLCYLLSTLLYSQSFPENAGHFVDTLTSSEMKGRGYTFSGHIKAAKYISDFYEKIGLKKYNNCYYQKFELKANIVTPEPELKINGRKIELGRDYLPNAYTGSGKEDNLNSIVDVGSGMVLSEMKIDELKGKIINNSVVIVNSSIPDSIIKNTQIDREEYSIKKRLEQISRLNPKAILILSENIFYRSPQFRLDVPIFVVKKETIQSSIKNLSFKVKSEFTTVQSQNVIGYIPGKENRDSTIIISAHYDHVSALSKEVFFPGANDNASGTAMIMCLAQYFLKQPLDYNLAVIAFSGEETGLQGSKYFAENSPIDLSKCKFILNLDMVGSGDFSIMAVGGIDFPEKFNLLKSINDSLNLGKIGKRKSVPNSDHYPIVQKGVEGFFLYTKDGTQPYHHVDDVKDTFEWDDFQKVYILAKEFLQKIK